MKSFIVIVAWTSENRIKKYQDFDTRKEANKHIAALQKSFSDAFMVEDLGDDVWNWLIDPVAKTVSLDVLPVEPEPSLADHAEEFMETPFGRAWVKRQAAKEGKKPRQVMDEIRANA